jgi:hypothetical protein
MVAWVQGKRSHLPHISMKADKENYGAVCFRVRHAEIPPMGPINAASALFISISSVVRHFQDRKRVMGNHAYAWSAHHLQLTKQGKVVLPIQIHLPFLGKVMATVQLRRSHLPHSYIKADKENYGAVCFRVRHAEIPPMGPINAASALFISIPSVVSPFQGRRRVMGNHGYAWSAHHLQLTYQRKVVLPIWNHLPFLAKVVATVQMKI